MEGEIAKVCGLLNATTARLVELIAEVLTTESWTGHGIRSPEHWVAWQCGVSASRAHRLVVMARRLIELPEAAAAFAAGELSEDQLAVVARHAPVHNDSEITELARHATVSQLSRTLRSYPFVDPPKEEVLEERREVRFGYTDTGRWRLRADLPADEGALMEQALVAQREQLFREAEEGDEVTWADALVSLVSGGHTYSARSAVLIHLNTGSDGQPVAHLHGGPALPDALRRYLTCDTYARPVWETDAKPVSVGRARRTVPRRTRTIVEERDRGCRTPGCNRIRWLHIHHIVHWEDGGPTDTGNLVCLCPRHHRAHHRGFLGITGDADQADALHFSDQCGRALRPNGQPRPLTDPPHRVAPSLGIDPGTYQHPAGERLDPRSIGFTEPPDPDAA